MTNKKKYLISFFILFLLSCVSLSSAWGDSNFLPSPYPLCSMAGKTSGVNLTINALYSNVNTDNSYIDFSGLSAFSVKENPEIGKPSFHFGLFGETMNGEKSHEAGQEDVTGYTLGMMFTPSFVLTQRYDGFRPSVFIGSSILYQKLNVDKFQYSDDYFEMLRIARIMDVLDTVPLYAEPRDKEVIQAGLHAGFHLRFKLDSASFSPFLMAQVAKGQARWTYLENTEINSTDFTSPSLSQARIGNTEKISTSLAVYTAGFEFHLYHPGISLIAMAQAVREKNEEDAEVYTMMTGIIF